MTDVTVANDLLICANYLQSNELLTKAQTYFADRSIPLSERWGLFCRVGKFVGKKTWTYPRGMRTVPIDFFVEEFGPLQLHRREEMTTVDMVDILETFINDEEYQDYESIIIEWAENTGIGNIKEEVLSMFLWAFRMDY